MTQEEEKKRKIVQEVHTKYRVYELNTIHLELHVQKKGKPFDKVRTILQEPHDKRLQKNFDSMVDAYESIHKYESRDQEFAVIPIIRGGQF